mmetsp:Transcript_48645/g.77480  ORF Transcript_48645/g.77480 Transcript_48645/m.77480 type:complete len:300 (+) Transcript_48645:742-1641(+)
MRRALRIREGGTGLGGCASDRPLQNATQDARLRQGVEVDEPPVGLGRVANHGLLPRQQIQGTTLTDTHQVIGTADPGVASLRMSTEHMNHAGRGKAMTTVIRIPLPRGGIPQLPLQEPIARMHRLLGFGIGDAVVALVFRAGHQPLTALVVVADQHVTLGVVGIAFTDTCKGVLPADVGSSADQGHIRRFQGHDIGIRHEVLGSALPHGPSQAQWRRLPVVLGPGCGHVAVADPTAIHHPSAVAEVEGTVAANLEIRGASLVPSTVHIQSANVGVLQGGRAAQQPQGRRDRHIDTAMAK